MGKSKFLAQLGGVFLYSTEPKPLAEWYQKAFDLEYEYTSEYKAYYLSLPYQDTNENRSRYMVFSILQKEEVPSLKTPNFTLNLRVKDLEALSQHLKAMNHQVSDIEVHDEGKFAWCSDPQGNRIELWEDVA